MPAFFKDYSAFYGTGEKNEAGQTLDEFLEAYDPYRYKTPSCTTDAVVFSYEGEFEKNPANLPENLRLLLIRRKNHPSIGFWALPGGFINLKENLDDTARRELEEETKVRGIAMEQIGTWGDFDRDPRARVITTAYMALVKRSEVEVEAGDDAADAVWCDVSLEETARAEESGWIRTTYSLKVENREKGIRTCAVVERKVRTGIIREERYEIKERGRIAADHAAIIVQALGKLKERMGTD